MLTGVAIAKSLKKIILADNQFTLEDKGVWDAIEVSMTKNQNLGKYDFRYNVVTNNCKQN